MKKLSIDLMLGRKTKCYIRKFLQSNVFIFATLPVGKQQNTTLRSQMGQYG